MTSELSMGRRSFFHHLFTQGTPFASVAFVATVSPCQVGSPSCIGCGCDEDSDENGVLNKVSHVEF